MYLILPLDTGPAEAQPATELWKILFKNTYVVKFYAVLIIFNHKQKDALFRLAVVIKKKKNVIVCRGFPGDSVVKNPPASAEATSSIPGLGRSPGVGNGSPFQYCCLEYPMDRGAWWATVHRVMEIRHD